MYSHRTHNIPGELVRLLSCSDTKYQLPKHSYPKYRVVRTPDFNAPYKFKDNYSPRNRPSAMAYWLNGRSEDDPHPPSGDDTIIMAVDPDMIFLHNQLFLQGDPPINGSNTQPSLLEQVQPGHGVASRYAIGERWIHRKQWFQFWCSPSTSRKNQNCADNIPTSRKYDPSFGHPQLLTANDARRQAEVWTNVTNDLRLVHQGWQTEMYSNVISMHLATITVSVHDIMVSNPNDINEQTAWEALQWYAPFTTASNQAPYLFMAHYCQSHRLGDFILDKRRMEVNLQKCGPELLLPSPNGETQNMLDRMKYNRSMLHGQYGAMQQEPHVTLTRDGWMIDKVYRTIQEAIGAYYEEFCQGIHD
jgi:hypothetical protein